MEGTTPRGNPNVNYRHWMMMMCQCRLTNCAKGTTLVENADSGRGCACVGAGGICELFLLNFAMNLKLL